MASKCTKDPDECELDLVKQAMDKYKEKIGKRIVNTPEITKIITILENFLRSKRLICYGGIALNNILPEEDQFYNKDIELPDYDFYSINARDDAIELADLYYSKGYRDIDAKAGVHTGTFKVFVNFMAVADITVLPEIIFNKIYKTSIVIDGIHYADANFLRMNIFHELSNPDGDSSRFEKVYKRLLLLNKHYPVTISHKCNHLQYKRKMSNRSHVDLVYKTLLNVFIKNKLVFFGGHALSMFAKYVKSKEVRKQFQEHEPDFDVFSNKPMSIIDELQEKFNDLNIPFNYKKHEAIGEILNTNYELFVYDDDTVGFIYIPSICHSYNTINMEGQQIRIASIDTMLYMYYKFYHIDKPYYNPSRILCMTQFLFQIQVENKYSQEGVLTRFPMKCYGYQPQLEEIKNKKSKIYEKYKNDKSSEEYQNNFFKYDPSKQHDKKNNSTKNGIKNGIFNFYNSIFQNKTKENSDDRDSDDHKDDSDSDSDDHKDDSDSDSNDHKDDSDSDSNDHKDDSDSDSNDHKDDSDSEDNNEDRTNTEETDNDNTNKYNKTHKNTGIFGLFHPRYSKNRNNTELNYINKTINRLRNIGGHKKRSIRRTKRYRKYKPKVNKTHKK